MKKLPIACESFKTSVKGLSRKDLLSKVQIPHSVYKELKAISALQDMSVREYMYKAILEKIQKDKIILLKPI